MLIRCKTGSKIGIAYLFTIQCQLIDTKSCRIQPGCLYLLFICDFFAEGHDLRRNLFLCKVILSVCDPVRQKRCSHTSGLKACLCRRCLTHIVHSRHMHRVFCKRHQLLSFIWNQDLGIGLHRPVADPDHGMIQRNIFPVTLQLERHPRMLTVRHTGLCQMLHCQSADFQHMLFFLSFSLLLCFSKKHSFFYVSLIDAS